MKIKSLVLVTFALGVLSQANAILVDNGTYTTDNETGLDWLDVNETRGMSYSQIVAACAEGGDFFGWRLATSDELIGLSYNGNSFFELNASHSASYQDAMDFIVMFGGFAANNNGDLYGYVANNPILPTGYATYYGLMARSYGHVVQGFKNDAVPLGYDDSTIGFGYENAGGFLVRKPASGSVEAPDSGSTVALLGAVLLGLIGLRSRLAK